MGEGIPGRWTSMCEAIAMGNSLAAQGIDGDVLITCPALCHKEAFKEAQSLLLVSWGESHPGLRFTV